MAAELATGLDATPDDRLLQAEALVRDWCGWHIAPTKSETITLATTGTDLLLLPTLHLTAVTSVTVEGGAVVDPTTYEWSPEGVVRRTSYRLWCYDPSRFVINFTHGYPSPPPAVTAVVQALASRAVANPGSLLRTQVGPYGDTYSQTGTNQAIPLALLEAEKNVLARYALPPRP